MPEEPEVDTDRLRESIADEVEHDGGRFLRLVALTTAFLAAFAAIAALRAGGTANEALVLKTEATQRQAEASDQWAFFQAKGVKASVAEARAESWRALGKAPPSALVADESRYAAEQQRIDSVARHLERERDERSAEADHLLRQHHLFADTVALLQVAIALGAVAALTRTRAVWLGSLAVGVAAVVLGVIAWTRT